MPPEGLFERSTEDTRTAIMEATYHALTEYGYADLTIQHVADEFDKSKSLLYHYYDGKDDLLVGFLEFVLDYFQHDVSLAEGNRADERLYGLFDGLLSTDPDVSEEFTGVVVGLRARAVHDADYRSHFTESNEFFRNYIADIVADGIEEGTFRDVDPDQTAAFLLTVVNGGMTERLTTEDSETVQDAREELDRYVEDHLLKAG